MDTSLYINKNEKHLADATTYNKVDDDPTQAIRNDVLFTLPYLDKLRQINHKARYHLTPLKLACTPLFYGLSKVHKLNIPLQLIVSACDSPTHQFADYVTHFIQPLVEIVPSYIPDSKHLFQLLESLPPLPKKCYLGHG